VVAGAAAAVVPFLAYFAVTGGLRLALEQSIGTLFSRGAQSAQKDTLSKLAHLLATVRTGCPGGVWLAAVGLAGMGVYLLWLWRWRRSDRLGAGLALAVYHYGVVGFSLFDFQSYGDLFILLHSVVFFAAVAFAELARALLRIRLPRRQLAPAVSVFALALVTRPSLWRSDFAVLPPNVTAETTLDDQRDVCRQLAAVAAGRRQAVVGPAEMLFLSETRNGVPFVYWNSVTWRYYRQRPREAYLDTLGRLLDADGALLLILDRPVPREPGDRILVSNTEAYGITVRTVR